LQGLLVALRASASSNPYWHKAFWDAVQAAELRHGSLPEGLQMALRKYGWSPGVLFSGVVPQGLDTDLGKLASGGGLPPHGTGPSSAGTPAPLAAGVAEIHSSLAPDLRRAAPEIWRSMKASGFVDVRNWTKSVIPEKDPQYPCAWDGACTVDFATAQCAGEAEILDMLRRSDAAEIALRRLSALVYQNRTGDKAGALHMLAVRPPSSQGDVAPTWLIDEATIHSRADFRRAQQVAQTDVNQEGRITLTQRGRGAAKGDGRGRGAEGGGGKGDGGGGRGGGGRGRGRGR
jgi:hypothetical protein